MASGAGYNKVFILDKYFTELTKYWQSEYQLQEKQKCAQQPNYKYPQFQTSLNKILDSGPIANSMVDINDLIHLDAPITEDSLIRALQSRFMANECFTNIGPVLISINAFNEPSNALTLNSTHQNIHCSPLLRVVHEAVRQQTETGYPQAIILSGINGSGKTYSSMVILRQLFNVVGGGPETDSFKHLAAAFTVLRSLGSAKTINNSESSRIGNFIEVQVTDGAIYRTKIHCYFLDQSRVVKTPLNERNYHIFYQMLAGLSADEKKKLYLDGYSIADFNYLNSDSLDFNYSQDATRFQAWKSCLSVLGIPFMDVVRVLAAVLLLGNIQFDDTSKGGQESETQQHSLRKEIQAVANLLGVSGSSLYKGFSAVTYCNAKGQIIKSRRGAPSSENVRDSLAKALYIRTVATIIRRANSSKRLGSSCGTTSSESNESIHNQLETGSHNAPSSIGSACGKSYKTMAVLNNAVRYAMDGFIGILDMFGFEDGRPSRLEQLCINLCAETMQHFYCTHVFKASIESCRDEGVDHEYVEYVDNVPCIDFISSLRTGLFSLLDVECRKGGNAEAFIEKIKSQHYGSARYFQVTPRCKNLPPNSTAQQLSQYFGIRHFVADVVYDTRHFIEANADKLCDDIISVFHKSQCTFGFVSHLFGAELRLLNSKGTMPRGLKFRIAPTSHLDQNSTEPVCTLTQDFHNRLDNLLRTLVHARPHFVRCIKINDIEQSGFFDRSSVMKQVRALQVLETVNLMAGGLPHRMRFKAFNLRYRLLVPFKLLRRDEENMVDDCQLILTHFEQRRAVLNCTSAASISWVLGKKHIFLSESARQQLELVRNDCRMSAAILLQSTWRGYNTRRKWPLIKQNLLYCRSKYAAASRSPFTLDPKLRPPRPQPITGTPPPFGPPQVLSAAFSTNSKPIDMCDFNMVRETCALLGFDLNTPPPLPSIRAYVVLGNAKLHFPQIRVVKMDYLDSVSKMQVTKGQSVLVLSSSSIRGFLSVAYDNVFLDLPCQITEILSVPGNVAMCI